MFATMNTRRRFAAALAGVTLAVAVARALGAVLEQDALSLRVAPENGAVELTDRKAGVTWRSQTARFGEVTLLVKGRPQRVPLGKCRVHPAREALQITFDPLTNGALLRVAARAVNERTLDISYEADAPLTIESIRLLDSLFATTGTGYVVVPVREGLLVPGNSGREFTQRFDTYAYEGCHMAMFGVVREEAAALVTWNDLYPNLEVRSVVEPSAPQVLTPSLLLRQTGRSFRIQLLGRSDYVGIAQAYRAVARERGWLGTWEEKLKQHPDAARYFGASNVKLWSVLTRRMNDESTREESLRVNWTFEEAAQVAEHLKRDLELDRVLFTLGGWIHRGYDNQHPDILPAAPECGGDAALADCARRVRELGYLFCLHDNYQDIYRDSPSWNERYIQKAADGSLTKGGQWAGGRAYITCAQMALELAQRPQNLRAVKKLTGANSYFIDTTYAAGLQECFDTEHPLTRHDDLRWKQALSDYARALFGTFGSECGREWALPHADFFEGLTAVGGKNYHSLDPARFGASVVPLFELVYRDTIALYGKYGYDPANAAEYVLHHVAIGRPLHYHSMPAHLYWQQNGADEWPVRASMGEFKQRSQRTFSLSYRWTVTGRMSNTLHALVHFTDAKGKILFQGDFAPTPPMTEWKSGEITQGPFTVSVPPELEGTFDVRVGLYDRATGSRATLLGRGDGEQRYVIGKLNVNGAHITCTPAATRVSTSDPALFTRADRGWARGMHRQDRFLKNTHEILSPLNEITSRVPMTKHEFLSPDRKVQRSVFGDNTAEVVVNMSSDEFRWNSQLGGEVVLPPLGFLVEASEFVAFHASRWNGRTYADPPLFTLRSTDGKPLAAAAAVRVFHGFGDEWIDFRGATHRVQRASVVK